MCPALENEGGVPDTEDESFSVGDDEEVVEDPENEPLKEEDFPGHFQESRGRLFSSHGNTYPLPVDGHEQARWRSVHDVLQRVVNGHYFGPVAAALASAPGIRKRGLDIGTGTGLWAIDMAKSFPRVVFDGVDIVPIMTRLPPKNAHFIIMDMNGQLQYANQIFHVVHARTIALAVVNWEALLTEVKRIMVPGGVFLSGEFSPLPILEGREDYTEDPFPNTYRFFDYVQTIAPNRQDDAAHIDQYLAAVGGYDKIVREQFIIPVGTWPEDDERREIGQIMREAFHVYLKSFGPSFLERGWTEAQYSNLINEVYEEVGLTPGSCVVYNTVHAIRV